jgi:hypothetical protein
VTYIATSHPTQQTNTIDNSTSSPLRGFIGTGLIKTGRSLDSLFFD